MQRRHILLGLAGLPLISSCEYLHNRSDLDWTEDVLLPDGRVVTLKRHQEFRGPHQIGEPPSASAYWFEFTNSDTGQKVRWENKTGVSTLVLIISNKVPYLLLTPDFGANMYYYNYPNPDYILYKFNGIYWEYINIEKIPFKKIRVNMSFNFNGMRKEIERSNYHLKKEQTYNSFYQGSLKYIIDFNKMVEPQTFGKAGRNRGMVTLLNQD